MKRLFGLCALALVGLGACSSTTATNFSDKRRCSEVILAIDDWQKTVKTQDEMRAVLAKTYDSTPSTKPYAAPLAAMLKAVAANDPTAFASAARDFQAACP